MNTPTAPQFGDPISLEIHHIASNLSIRRHFRRFLAFTNKICLFYDWFWVSFGFLISDSLSMWR